MATALQYPVELHFDGVQQWPDAQGRMRPLAPVQQGAYWGGFRMRLVAGTGAESLSDPLAQIRTAPVDRAGAWKATMRQVEQPGGYWKFDLPSADTVGLPFSKLVFDVMVIDDQGEVRFPVVGTILVIPQVSRRV